MFNPNEGKIREGFMQNPRLRQPGQATGLHARPGSTRTEGLVYKPPENLMVKPELTPGNLAGAWYLHHIDVDNAAGTVRVVAPEVNGSLVYTKDGHMSVIVQADQSLFGFETVAYAGISSVSGDQITHHVTVGAPPMSPGTVQVRTASLALFATLSLSGHIGDSKTILTWSREIE